MIFLVISQRAKTNPNFLLKDLPGHGRFDIIPRVIMAASGDLMGSKSEIYIFMKGGKYGWIKWPLEIELSDEDEISIANILKENWNNYFTHGSLSDLLEQLSGDYIFLSEDGSEFNISKDYSNSIIVLGAQRDLTDEDLLILGNMCKISLGSESMLASHAIVYFRQLVLINK